MAGSGATTAEAAERYHYHIEVVAGDFAGELEQWDWDRFKQYIGNLAGGEDNVAFAGSEKTDSEMASFFSPTRLTLTRTRRDLEQNSSMRLAAFSRYDNQTKVDFTRYPLRSHSRLYTLP